MNAEEIKRLLADADATDFGMLNTKPVPRPAVPSSAARQPAKPKQIYHLRVRGELLAVRAVSEKQARFVALRGTFVKSDADTGIVGKVENN